MCLQKLTFAQLVKKSPYFMESEGSLTALKTVRRLSLSQVIVNHGITSLSI